MKILAEKILFPDVYLDVDKLRTAVEGKTIVITGASYGIGEQLVLLLSRLDVSLILIARSEDKLKVVANQAGVPCKIIVADLYLESDVDKVIRELTEIEGGIDIFISNAGKSIMRSLENSLLRYHDFTRTNSLNYLAPVKILLALTPLIRKRGGQIINVSALNVLLLPAPKWAAYQASKTAFDQWFRCNTAEWKLMHITAKTIYLPLVRTKMIAPNDMYRNTPAMQPEQAAERIAKLIYSSAKYSKPWWAIFPQAVGFYGRIVWGRLSLYLIQKKNEKV